MAVDPGTATLLAAAARLAFDLVVRFLGDDISHDDMLRILKSVINDARDQIIEVIQSLRLDDLEGDIAGLMATFAAYDPIAQGGTEPNESEGERLRGVIDHAAQVIGDLSALIRNQSELEIVFGCVPMLATVVALRTAAMVERTYTYGIDDAVDIPPMLSDARALLRVVRRKSDGRFGPIELRLRGEPGFADAGYRFNGRFQFVRQVSVNKSGNPLRPLPASIAAARARHMERAFLTIPGVSVLAAFRLARPQTKVLKAFVHG